GNAGPKTERREERGGKTQIIFDKKCSDNPREAGNSIGHIDHERRKIGEPHFAAQREDVAVNPVICRIEHEMWDQDARAVRRRSTSMRTCSRMSSEVSLIRSPCPAKTHSNRYSRSFWIECANTRDLHTRRFGASRDRLCGSHQR